MSAPLLWRWIEALLYTAERRASAAASELLGGLLKQRLLAGQRLLGFS